MTTSKNLSQTARTIPGERFSELLQSPTGGRAPYNQILLERSDWVIAPTVGPIVPNWLIAVPRRPALSFRDWTRRYRFSPLEIIADLCVHLRISLSDIVWFEHGPADFNSPVGCGTDYAHLHIIFQPKFIFGEFVTQSASASKLVWKRTTLEDTYKSLPDSHSYLVAGSGDLGIYTSQVESTGSQFFRRVVGALSDSKETWNYIYYPHTKNVFKTIDNFRYLERIALSGTVCRLQIRYADSAIRRTLGIC